MNAINVLVTGHRPNRLPEEKEKLDKIQAGLRSVIHALETFATSSERKLRVIVGDAPGTDQWAQSISQDRKIEVIVGGVLMPADALPEGQLSETAFWLSDASPESNANSRHHAAIDETKLFYADIVIVVWDGGTPAGTAAGSVRNLIEAIHQRKPVLWIDASCDSPGSLRWFDFSRLDSPAISLLDADEGNVQHLGKHFRDLPQEPVPLLASISGQLEKYLLPKSAVNFDNLIRIWDPRETSIKAGWFHSAFLRLFGYPRIEGGRYKSYPIAGFEPTEDTPSSLWDQYHALDRAAVKASHVYRDQIVIAHLLAAFAVFCAVAGNIALDSMWGIAEFIALAVILMVVWRDRKRILSVHRTHLALRHGAETFRILAVLRPFLASLPRIERNQWSSAPTSVNGFELRTPQTWWVLRWLRDEGVPKAENFSQYTLKNELAKLKVGLIAFIDDQKRYHKKSHQRWHRIHHRIEFAMKIIFGLAMTAVLAHLYALGSHYTEHHGWSLPDIFFNIGHVIHENSAFLLIVTAFGPALAASFHGISGKLEIARLGAHSETMHKQLDVLRSAVEKVETSLELTETSLMTLRGLAVQTANTLYTEHEAWAALLDGQDLDIPA